MVDPVGNANRAPGFVDLSPTMGAPLPETGETLNPPGPAGWAWYTIDGSKCRDGSPAGFFLHRGNVGKLLIYLEGGGACSNGSFCNFNPVSVNTVLAGDGSNVFGTAAGTGPGRQQPGSYTDSSHTGAPAGIFATENAANPFMGWNQVYVPYCTGDVHYGKKENAMVPGSTVPQQFAGGRNMELFIGQIVPTFKDSVDKVVLTGSSAGGFGAALNFSMVQDAFGDVQVFPISDSGPPFNDQYMPVCMQKRWREGWGFQFPPDCQECQQADGGGMLKLADFLMRKHPNASVGIISSTQDEVIRLFFSVGLNNCANFDTADAVITYLAKGDTNTYYPGPQYAEALNDIRTSYQGTGRLATYYMALPDPANQPGELPHQHLFRPSFYTTTVGGKTMPQFITEFIGGTNAQVGP
jgi:hypothetical protein